MRVTAALRRHLKTQARYFWNGLRGYRTRTIHTVGPVKVWRLGEDGMVEGESFEFGDPITITEKTESFRMAWGGDYERSWCADFTGQVAEVSWESSEMREHAVLELMGFTNYCGRDEIHEGRCVPPNVSLGQE